MANSILLFPKVKLRGLLIKYLLRGFTKVRYNITITSLGGCDLWRNFFQGADRKRREETIMNFYDKKVRRIVTIVILLIIVAMVATMIIPYLVV